MSANNKVIDNIEGYSTAMYSTWMYYKPARVLFDAGEGICLSMRNFIFGIESIFISHGHYDHIGGLMGIIYSRAAAMGDKEKPLTIYHPRGWNSITELKKYSSTVAGHIKYDLNWVEVEDGQEISLGNERVKAVAFRVDHSLHSTCLGYNLVEDRSRLKSNLVGLSGSEIAKIVALEGRESVRETYRKIIFSYCGDSMPVKPSSVYGTDILVHEATFVDVNDREALVHSSIEEAVGTAMDSKAEVLIINHVSSRYGVNEAISEINRSAVKIGYDSPIFLLANRKMIKVN